MLLAKRFSSVLLSAEPYEKSQEYAFSDVITAVRNKELLFPFLRQRWSELLGKKNQGSSLQSKKYLKVKKK